MQRQTPPLPIALLPTPATLYLSLESNLQAEKLQQVTRDLGIELSQPFEEVWGATLSAETIIPFAERCRGRFSKQEVAAIRCRMLSEPCSIAELMRAAPLSHLLDSIDGQWLHSMLAERRLLTFFQPIVCLRDPTKVFAYECLLRGQDNGELVSPVRLYDAARATGQVDRLDAAARITAIQSAARENVEACVFVNFCPRNIRDPRETLEETVWAAAASGISPDRFVFEVVESEEIADVDQLVVVLDYLRNAGCRVALDDVGAGYSSLSILTRIKPDFIKLDMDLLRRVDTDQYKARVASKLLEMARELHIATVVEGIETPGELRWSQQHGADYAQGYLIARPAPTPPISSFSRQPHLFSEAARFATLQATTAK